MGYLRVVEIAWLHSRRWLGTLVVTAVAALIAGSASPALAQAGEAGHASTAAVDAKPLPSAGWRGQFQRMLLRAAGADRRAPARSSVIASPPAWPRGDASPMQYDDRHPGPGVAASVLLALVLSPALAGLALLARAARRRRVARGPEAAPIPAGRRLAVSSRGLTAIGSARGRDAAEFKRHKAVIERACAQCGCTLTSGVRDSHAAKAGGRTLDHLARSARRLGVLLVGLDTSTHDARRTAPRLRRADTRNGSRVKRDEPIAAPLAPQAPVALIGWTR